MKSLDVMVSIVVPCYNVQQYIEECLDCLINQTYKNIEIICVDDGSTDATVDIIRQYTQKDERIRLIQQENQYAGVARNNGMAQAKGEYIIFLDSDDYFDVQLIEKLLKSAVENEADIVLCDTYFYNNETGEITEPSYVLNMSVLSHYPNGFCCEDIPDRIFLVGFPVPWNKLYKRAFIEENKLQFQNTRRCNDEYFVSMSMVLAKKITHVNERLVTYRVNNSESLQGYGDKKISFDFYKAFLAIKEMLVNIEKYEEIENAFINKVVLGSLSALRKQKLYESYFEMYRFIKDVVFHELQVYEYDIEKVFVNQKDLINIKEMDAQQFLFREIQMLKECAEDKHTFPYKEVGNARNVAIYGAGDVGKAYHRQLAKGSYYKLIAWYDRNYLSLREKGYNVTSPEELDNSVFDKIVIAINDDTIKAQIYDYLIQKGIDSEKIL